MPAIACPNCGAATPLASGASTTCRCGTDYWSVPGTDQGERFTGVVHDRAGFVATLWTALAASGVLFALLGILAAESWGVIVLLQQLRG